MTLAFLAPFLSERSRPLATSVRTRPVLVVTLHEPITLRRPAALAAQALATPPTRARAPGRKTQVMTPLGIPQAAMPQSQAPAPVEDSRRADAPAVPARAASAPLRLDANTLREASRASRSEVGRLARESGTYVGDAPPSKEQQIADGVARTAKPDCLREGGSLLSVFVIGYELLANRCK